MSNRRQFIRRIGGLAAAITTSSLADLAARERYEMLELQRGKAYSANDKIRVGVVGMGIIGVRNTRTFLELPGLELAAVCDLYTGRSGQRNCTASSCLPQRIIANCSSGLI